MKLHTNFLLLEHGFRIQFCGHLFLYRESKAIYRYSGLPLLSFDVVYNLRKKKMASHGQVSFSFYGLTQAHSFCGSSPTPNPPPPSPPTYPTPASLYTPPSTPPCLTREKEIDAQRNSRPISCTSSKKLVCNSAGHQFLFRESNTIYTLRRRRSRR